jgi:hypothetical protein
MILSSTAKVARTTLLVFLCFGLSKVFADAQVAVNLTIQEALYPGSPTKGIARTQDPVTVGLPLADSAGVNSISQLSLEGTSLGQFRVLGRWPSGNIKWVLVDTEADLSPGGKNTGITLTTGGKGNFGGPDLATDNGSTVTVNTGAGVFTIRKANFDVFDQVEIGSKRLISSGSSQGLVIMGPASPSTSCNPGPCTTPYLSRNDNNSTAIIEENGPARAVIKADGIHKDAAGNGYMRFTVRMHFYKNKTYVKLSTILRNADEGASNTFNSAAKGFTSYELRLTPALDSGRTFAFGKDVGSISRKFSGSEDAYLYQTYSNNMENQCWNAATCPYGGKVPRCVAPFIRRTGSQGGYTYAQDGYQIVQNQSVLATEDHSHYPTGWGDLSDGAGAGIEVGVYELAAYWPKSLQFQGGGAEARVGIWPDQTLSPANPGAAIPYYQAWPQYSIHDLYINFHADALVSPAEEFLKFQHYLMARAPAAYYNDTQVFFYPLLDPKEEDSYWNGVSSSYGFRWTGNSPAVTDRTPQIFRLYAWQMPGGSNQSEVRWGYIQQWLARGLTGRFLTAAHFYRYQVEQAFPRSDMNAAGTATFDWRTHSPASDLDGFGFPANIHSANSAYVNRTWVDEEHAHWYGMGDYYFLTGDESIKDQMLDGVGDRFLNPSTILGSGHLWNTRAVGGQLMGLARYRQFLDAIGDKTDLATVDAIADATLVVSVFPELCVSGYPPGCTPSLASRGVSRTRGIADGGQDVGSDNNCAVGGGQNIRCAKPWMMGIEEQGMWEIAQARGNSWPNNHTGVSNPYQLTLDLAYGMGNWTSHEDFVLGGGYNNSSLKYDLAMDYANPMSTPTPGTDSIEQYEFNYFTLGKYNGFLTAKERKQFELTYLHMAAGTSFNASNVDDHDMYLSQVVIQALLHPSVALEDVPLNVTNNGDGSYTLTWTAPHDVQVYRIKQANNSIVDWIGFNPKTNAFIGDPAKNINWFAATEVTTGPNSTCPPPPGGTGIQSCTIKGLDPNSAWYFALRARAATK